jgi:S-disulfanyl-L-cysteine oxidoreductase SoxD
MRLERRLAVLLLGLATAGGVQAGPQSSVWQGVYSGEQSNRGKVQYEAHCAVCHGATLNGSDTAPELNGGTFVANWDGLSVADLFARIRTTMPANDPGSLSDEVVTDVIAYLLSVNQFPAGSRELLRDPGALKQIGITKAAP